VLPLNLHVSTNLPYAPFLSRLTVAQGGSHQEEVKSALSPEVHRPAAEGKMA